MVDIISVNETVAPAQAALSVGKVAEGDVVFLQGMIPHHFQTLEMVGPATHPRIQRDLLALGERINDLPKP